MTEKGIELILNELKILNNTVHALDNRISSVEGKMATKDDLDAVKSTMATKNDLDAVKSTMATKDDIKDVMLRIDHVSEQVAQNSEDIVSIKNTVNLIASIQDRQEQTIDLLARRSIDHEAELKRIK